MAKKATRTGNLWGGAYRATKVTAADGSATFTFPTGLFKDPPVVVATGVTTDGRDISVSLVGAPTATGVAIQARKSQKLPAVGLINALLGFDPYTPVAATVHLIAWRAS